MYMHDINKLSDLVMKYFKLKIYKEYVLSKTFPPVDLMIMNKGCVASVI